MIRGVVVVTMLLLPVARGAVGATTRAAADARVPALHDKDHAWDFRADFPDRAAWERRAEFLRTQVLVAQGLWPMPVKTALNPVTHGRIDREGYTIEKVFFASLPGHYVSGNLYRPKGKTGKLPAVLCPYGHWPDGRFIWKNDAAIDKEIKSGAETDRDAARSPLQANLAMLAQMGCIAFQYDMVGYCDSMKIAHREGFLDAEATLRLQSFMGLQTWNSIRAMDFLLGLPDVDPDRVAITGSSSGATQAIALNGVDQRINVAFPMVMVGMAMQGGCVCENAPLYRVQTNNVELACLFAPKPQGMAAANDWTRDFMTRGLPEMKSIWKLYGADEHVWGGHVNFGHNHNLPSREMQYSFLNRELKLGLPEPVKEKPFVPVPPRELSVYDDAHPLPADALDAAGVRKWMTTAADEEIARLASDPAARAKFLSAALRAMVVDPMPMPADVRTDTPIELVAGGRWEGFVARAGSAEQVPASVLWPKDWNGKVVIWADPRGRASADGETGPLLDSGSAIVAIDLIGSESRGVPVPASRASTKPDPNPPFLGYTLGYERGVFAGRVHDLLSAVALAHGLKGVKSVHLIGLGDSGPAALLARALAGDQIDRAAIDLNGFDFDLVTDTHDPRLLPGGLKYGGISAFIALCTNGKTLIARPRQTAAGAGSANPSAVTLRQVPLDAPAGIAWVLE